MTADYLRTLFLHPPSYDGFDGGAGSRYQARREVRSFWYPTWLAQPAALVPDSRLVDAPPDGLTLEDVRPLARDYELAVLHTSTPSFAHDVRVAEALKADNPISAARAPATRHGGRCGHSGTPRGSPSPPRSSPTRDWWTRRPTASRWRTCARSPATTSSLCSTRARPPSPTT